MHTRRPRRVLSTVIRVVDMTSGIEVCSVVPTVTSGPVFCRAFAPDDDFILDEGPRFLVVRLSCERRQRITDAVVLAQQLDAISSRPTLEHSQHARALTTSGGLYIRRKYTGRHPFPVLRHVTVPRRFAKDGRHEFTTTESLISTKSSSYLAIFEQSVKSRMKVSV